MNVEERRGCAQGEHDRGVVGRFLHPLLDLASCKAGGLKGKKGWSDSGPPAQDDAGTVPLLRRDPQARSAALLAASSALRRTFAIEITIRP